MKLKQYLQIRKMSQETLARKIGVSLNHMNGVVTGRIKPGKFLIEKILDVCEGNVSEKDLLDPSQAEDLEVLLIKKSA